MWLQVILMFTLLLCHIQHTMFGGSIWLYEAVLLVFALSLWSYLVLMLCIMYYTVCYLTVILYAVVRKISMLFIDNKIYVFYICPLADQPKSLHHCPCQQTFRYCFVRTSPSIDKTHAGASRNAALSTAHDQNRLKICGHNLKLVLVGSLRALSWAKFPAGGMVWSQSSAEFPTHGWRRVRCHQ